MLALFCSQIVYHYNTPAGDESSYYPVSSYPQTTITPDTPVSELRRAALPRSYSLTTQTEKLSQNVHRVQACVKR